MRTTAELNHERPQHERWVALSVEAGQMTPYRAQRDLRVLRERVAVLGERRPSQKTLAARWGCSVGVVCKVLALADAEDGERATQAAQEQRIAAALVARRARAEAQRIEREARAVQAAERARVEQAEHEHQARLRWLDRHHDAWLVEARTRGPLTEHEALVDLGVLRWRGPLPSWTSIGDRWGWRPRSQVGPLLDRFPTSTRPDFAHVVEVPRG